MPVDGLYAMESNFGSNDRNASPGDHLANERTFLAWVRSALGISAFGFVIIKFSVFLSRINLLIDDSSSKDAIIPPANQHIANLTGILMISFGGILLLLSYLRFNTVKKELEKGVYKSRSSLLLFLVVFIFLMTVLLIINLNIARLI